MSEGEPRTEFKSLLHKLELEHKREVDRLRAQIDRLQQENVRARQSPHLSLGPRGASRPPLGPVGSEGSNDGSLHESGSNQSAPVKLRDVPPGFGGSAGPSRKGSDASRKGSDASFQSTPAKRQGPEGPGGCALPSREGSDGSLPQSAESAPARLQKEFSGGLVSETSGGTETPRRAETWPRQEETWALSPRPLQRPPAPGCPPIPMEEVGLGVLSGRGHSPPHTDSTQAPRTCSTHLSTYSPRGPMFGPRVKVTEGPGMPRPSPSAAPKIELDAGPGLEESQSQRVPPLEGHSFGLAMPTLAGLQGLLSPRSDAKELSVAERCSSHCKLEDGSRHETTAEACSTQVGEDSCLKAHLLEAETGGFQGPAIAIMDSKDGQAENGHDSLEENMPKWKSLLDAVQERLDGRAPSQFMTSAMWVDALEKERPSNSPSGQDEAQIELGSVLRFLKKDWLVDGGRRSASGAMETLGGGGRPPNRWTLYPNGRKRLVWDVLGCLLLLHDLIMIPMVAFENKTSGMSGGYKVFETRFQYASASFWTLDIFVSFITGFHSSEGFVEMDAYKVARNYIRSWLCLDLVIVAVDWCSIFVSNLGDASDSLRLGKTASRIMRVFRLLRFAKMNTHMQDMMNMINSEYIQQFMGLLKLLVAIVIVNHYVACFWFLVAATNPTGKVTWAQNAFGVAEPWHMLYAYTTCLHWSLTQFTPASMEVVPENEVERTFNIVVIIMALVIFSSFVSSITSTMTHIRNINDHKAKQEAAVRGFFTEHHIPAKLVSRVWHFIKHHRRTVKKRTRLQDVQAFKGLPPSVKDEIRKAMFMPILRVHPLFAECGRIDPPALGEMLKTGTSADPSALHEQFLQSMGALDLDPKQDGGLVKEIVFVVRGALDYYQSNDGQVTVSVGEGQWCCEASLWVAEAVLEGTLLATEGGAEVVTLNSKRFQTVAKANPASLSFLARYAKLFTEKLNEAQMNPDYNCVLFNCEEEIQELVDESLKVNMGNVSLLKRTAISFRKSTATRPSQ